MFKKNPDAQSSRKLFRFSLIHLPTIILLMLITKYPLSDEKQNETILLDPNCSNTTDVVVNKVS